MKGREPAFGQLGRDFLTFGVGIMGSISVLSRFRDCQRQQSPVITVLQDDTPVIGYGCPRITRMTTRKDRGGCATATGWPRGLARHSSCRVGHGIRDLHRPRYKSRPLGYKPTVSCRAAIDAMRANPTGVQPWISTMQESGRRSFMVSCRARDEVLAWLVGTGQICPLVCILVSFLASTLAPALLRQEGHRTLRSHTNVDSLGHHLTRKIWGFEYAGWSLTGYKGCIDLANASSGVTDATNGRPTLQSLLNRPMK